MKLSPLGLALLAFAEDFKAVAYRDSGGVLTIAYGHTGRDVKEGMVCTPEQGEIWLAEDVGEAEVAVDRHVTLAGLRQHQFDALTMLVYNIGEHNFEPSTLLRYVNAGRPASDVADQFLLWTKVKGSENLGLKRRRRVERALYLGGPS